MQCQNLSKDMEYPGRSQVKVSDCTKLLAWIYPVPTIQILSNSSAAANSLKVRAGTGN